MAGLKDKKNITSSYSSACYLLYIPNHFHQISFHRYSPCHYYPWFPSTHLLTPHSPSLPVSIPSLHKFQPQVTWTAMHNTSFIVTELTPTPTLSTPVSPCPLLLPTSSKAIQISNYSWLVLCTIRFVNPFYNQSCCAPVTTFPVRLVLSLFTHRERICRSRIVLLFDLVVCYLLFSWLIILKNRRSRKGVFFYSPWN